MINPQASSHHQGDISTSIDTYYATVYNTRVLNDARDATLQYAQTLVNTPHSNPTPSEIQDFLQAAQFFQTGHDRGKFTLPNGHILDFSQLSADTLDRFDTAWGMMTAVLSDWSNLTVTQSGTTSPIYITRTDGGNYTATPNDLLMSRSSNWISLLYPARKVYLGQGFELSDINSMHFRGTEAHAQQYGNIFMTDVNNIFTFTL